MTGVPFLPPSSLRPPRLVVCLLFLLVGNVQGDDDPQSMLGLVAEYRGEKGPSVQRVDRTLSFDWGRSAPHPLIAPERFSVTWSGLFLHREQVPVTFHAYLSGRIQMKLGGQLVLAGQMDQAGWISGAPVTLSPGFHDVEVRYSKTSNDARVSLFWSSEAFPLEPLSAFLFSHEENVNRLEELERGRILYDTHRCNRCHARPNEQQSPPAPALWGVTQGLNPEWLIAKLQGNNREASQAMMPQFGLSDGDAAAIAAFLTHIGAPHELSRVPDVNKRGKQELPTGRELLLSVGCLSCHTVGELGNSSPYGGGDLSAIGAKRSPEWLATWLAQPDRLNPQHRMPLFQLTPTERSLLVQELSRLGSTGDETYGLAEHAEFTTAQVDRGRELVTSLRCANCHKIPAIESDVRDIPTLEQPVTNWEASCLGSGPDRERGRPVYSQADREALRRYVESRTGRAIHPVSEFDRGRQVLESRNCLGCHERDGVSGNVKTAGRVAAREEALRGLSEALIPPNLTAVGDKLQDEALKAAVSGEQREARLPWLKVRMPRFQHTEEQRSSLTAMLVAHDRIPDGAPARPKLSPVEATDATMLLGRRLVGVGGFNCIACHKIGDYEPRNVAFGTRGSDLMIVGERMRPEFFLRWTRSPLRIVPGMEMPSYLRPIPGVLNEELGRQFSTLWAAISHPDFEPPTNPTQVEQFLVVEPGGRPRIVRDVFTLSEAAGSGAVARAFAVGFDNGHAVVFDADTATLRAWSYGDFARQRTEGKSWYWDLAGTLLVGEASSLGRVSLRNLATGNVHSLKPAAEDRLARLLSYEQSESPDGRSAVHLAYRADFKLDGTEREMEIHETWRGIASESASGWRREIHVLNAPQGMEPVLVRDASGEGRFAARLRSFSLPDFDFRPIGDGRGALAFRREGTGWTTVAAYDCNLPAYAPATKPLVAVPGTAAPPQPAGSSSLALPVTTLPGYIGQRLDVPPSVMPTAMACTAEGELYFTSLKGHVYRLRDSDGDGVEDELSLFEEGLAAPFGVLPDGDALLVAHKPEILRLRDTNGDGRCDEREVVADGWGYTDNYHDWTTGPVRDAAGRLYVALGSDYSQPNRPLDHARWRGKVLRVNSDGTVDPIAHELRFPQGIALDHEGRLFVTDQQGHGNPFNELDYIVEGRRYGVPARLDEPREGPAALPAIQVPHPWTRSVNGLFFLPQDHDSPFAGHGIGCEYNGRFLVRYSLQEVNGQLQGAVYPFSRALWERDDETFLGPICGTVAPDGDILIGSIHDSGWLGGLNVGEIVRLSRVQGEIPNGIREVRAVGSPEDNLAGFDIEFIHPVDAEKGVDRENYSILGYTRIWEGSYATEDSDRYSPEIVSIELSQDRRTVTIGCRNLKPTYVYEIRCGEIGDDSQPELFPNFAAYTLNRIPHQ